jgi:dTDP-4-dehydrorhamnose reductase
MSPHICIIGSKGMLGRELVGLLENGLCPATLASRFARWDPRDGFWAAAPDVIPVRLTAMDVDELDITRRNVVLSAIGELRPTLVINAAAYTDVDGCETHESEAMAVNAIGPANLAEACRQRGARLVHVSTDYVFDGTRRQPYLPDDHFHPQSAYGRTKAAGEAEIRKALPDGHVIVRTSWLFGVHGKNFVKTIARLAGERPELRVVTDQVGCPTYAPDLAAALIVLGLSASTGTFHFCNAGECSWNAFAAEILRLAGADCRVLPMSSSELNRPAPRPAYSVLSTASLDRDTGLAPRPWQEALAECIPQLRA